MSEEKERLFGPLREAVGSLLDEAENDVAEYGAAVQGERDALKAEVERLRAALERLLDANATREHESMPSEEWDAIILATEEALDEPSTALSAAGSRAFAEALLDPPEPNDALRRLMGEGDENPPRDS